MDTDRNGVLDAGEVTATAYVCNGAPGPGITWVDVTGTIQQAAADTGYLTDNAAQVAITLPPTAGLSIGALVQVSGTGTGGWKIAQNAGQSIVTEVPGDANNGVSWTPRDSARIWFPWPRRQTSASWWPP